jgi:PAS domain-containing protein
MYLDRVARPGRDKELRERVGDVARRLKAPIEATGSPWASWDAPTRARVLTVVQRCVELFVRTSSPVEGHNGHLSLHHHRTHHLTPALLKALTVIHNYVIIRRDGTPAAERFARRSTTTSSRISSPSCRCPRGPGCGVARWSSRYAPPRDPPACRSYARGQRIYRSGTLGRSRTRRSRIGEPASATRQQTT